MAGLKEFKAATLKAQDIIANIGRVAADTPDAVEARIAELDKMKKDDLITLVIELEKPRKQGGLKVEDVVKELLEEPACACLTYEQIASMVAQVLPEAKTSSKSVASYASKKKDVWAIVKREKVSIDPVELLKEQAATKQAAVNA